MDKVIYLIDKECYNGDLNDILKLTEKDLEKWVAENDYESDNSILKIDANGYNSVDEALKGEQLDFLNKEDYYILTNF